MLLLIHICLLCEITYLYFYNLQNKYICSLYRHFYNLPYMYICILHNCLCMFHSMFLCIPFLFYQP